MKFFISIVGSESKANKIRLIFGLFCIAIFIIYNNLNDKRYTKYYPKIVEIRQWDSVNLKVVRISKIRDRAYLDFNDSLCIYIGNLEDNTVLNDIYYNMYDKLELPFYLKKATNNDTIWIVDNKNETYCLIFRKDRDPC